MQEWRTPVGEIHARRRVAVPERMSQNTAVLPARHDAPMPPDIFVRHPSAGDVEALAASLHAPLPHAPLG